MNNRLSSPTPGYFRWLWILEPRQQLAHLLRDVADRLDRDEVAR